MGRGRGGSEREVLRDIGRQRNSKRGREGEGKGGIERDRETEKQQEGKGG